MHTHFMVYPLILTSLAVVPQAARADDKPSLIRVADKQGKWTATKLNNEDNGKFKIFTENPKYNTVKTITSTGTELKKEGDSFTFLPDRDYWMVVYAKSTSVGTGLGFIKDGDPTTRSIFVVKGTYGATFWPIGPHLKFLGHEELITCNLDAFRQGAGAEGKPALPLLTLLDIEKLEMSAEDQALRAWELALRKKNGIVTVDPQGTEAERADSTTLGRATARDFWRLNLDPGKKQLTTEEAKKAYREMSLIFHPDRFKKENPTKEEQAAYANAGALFPRIKSSSERVLAAVENKKPGTGAPPQAYLLEFLRASEAAPGS